MTVTNTAEKAYSIAEAAAIKGVSPDRIKRAIHATTGNVLRAKRPGRSYLILASELDAWFDRLEDA